MFKVLRICYYILLSILSGVMLPLQAQERPETPDTLAGGKIITVQEAKILLDSGKAMFFDTRNPLNYAKGHIPTAYTAAYKEKSEYAVNFDATQDSFDLRKLPANLQTPIVFYSDGINGWKSYKAAVLAIRKGYKNVYYMRTGWNGWNQAKLPKQE